MSIETLLKKRAALDQKIEAAKLAAKRKNEVAELAEKAGILGLRDAVLETEFRKIASLAEQKIE
ncbi:MAG: hypothetical protein LC110_00450 [Burkholderiales bacterium]|nr:hypothetical protein [Burkholderiales bacterium]